MVGKKKKTTGDKAKVGETLTYHYIKNGNYRTTHVDGVHGGVTPKALIDMSFFAERFPIPLQTTHEVVGPKVVGKEVGRVSREGIIREIEFNIILEPDVAESVANWMLKKVSDAREAKKSLDETKAELQKKSTKRKPRRKGK